MPTGTPTPGLNRDAWAEELGDDPDRDFILSGIQHGFDIVDTSATPVPVDRPNNQSARLGAPLYKLATQQVLTEIRQGNYQVCDVKPPVVSPFSVLLLKPDGGIRLIHDGSHAACRQQHERLCHAGDPLPLRDCGKCYGLDVPRLLHG